MGLIMVRQMSSLQWGRNFIVAEIPERHHKHRLDHLASMGPQLYRCGNNDITLKQDAIEDSFNGAATLLLRKSITNIALGGRILSLQWGRNFIVAEILLVAP